MKGTVQVGVRLPKELVKSVDVFAKQKTTELGTTVTRTDAVRMLLTGALLAIKEKKR